MAKRRAKAAQNSAGTAPRGRPFQKGVSGNPGGRPSTKHLRELLEPHRETFVNQLVAIATDHKSGVTAKLQAIELALAYTDGKPVTPHSGKGSLAPGQDGSLSYSFEIMGPAQAPEPTPEEPPAEPAN